MPSLREAARRIDEDRRYVRGAADVLGIQLFWVGPSLTMTDADFRRLREHHGRRKAPVPADAAVA